MHTPRLPSPLPSVVLLAGLLLERVPFLAEASGRLVRAERESAALALRLGRAELVETVAAGLGRQVEMGE